MKTCRVNRFKHLLLSLPLALALSGCSTVTYVEPSSGPVARVRFVSDSDGITVVRSYSSVNCDGENEMMRLKNGFLFNSSPKRLGMPLWDYHDNAAKEFLISSNSPQIYMFDGNRNAYRQIIKCGVAIKQKFEEGKDYEIIYKMSGSSCYAEVSEIKNNESGQPEKNLLQKRDSKLNPEFSKSCIGEFKKLRFW